ncbi:hypothetical protein CRENBAI_015377 [Crenichthys baileyi]|uniref:Uncharacterized protein n=1 Tax=Crenichthys baileyi TaxID=28760 RepID=A0AAV9QQR1_9TELE
MAAVGRDDHLEPPLMRDCDSAPGDDVLVQGGEATVNQRGIRPHGRVAGRRGYWLRREHRCLMWMATGEGTMWAGFEPSAGPPLLAAWGANKRLLGEGDVRREEENQQWQRLSLIPIRH